MENTAEKETSGKKNDGKKPKREIIRTQARNIVKKVIEVCEQEKKNNSTSVDVSKAVERAALLTGLSKRTINNIKRESVISGNTPLKSPSRKGKKINFKRNVKLDEYNKNVIRRCIEEMYQSKTPPTCPKLLTLVRSRIDFPWGPRSLRNALKTMGFKWRKCNKKLLLVENPRLVFERSAYIRNVMQFRKEGREIYYIDERCVDSQLIVKKFSEKENDSILSNANKLIVINAASQKGFLPKAALVYYFGNEVGDYQGELNSVNYENWIQEQLLPNLPPRSVIVFDTAAYHMEYKVPTKSSLRKTMVEWLQKHNIPFNHEMRKESLYKLILLKKPKEKQYKMDELLKLHGHTVLRLPFNSPELSPMDMAWSKIRWILQCQSSMQTAPCQNNLNMKMSNLYTLTTEALSQLTLADWESFFAYVCEIEQKCWKYDGDMEALMDEFIINLVGGGPTNDEETTDDSDDENLDDGAMDESDSDEEDIPT